MKGIVLSLCDRTGVMVQPWLEAGYECWIVDTHHAGAETRLGGSDAGGALFAVGADVRTWLPLRRDYAIVFAFPPCTHLAVSGARWFAEKGIGALVDGLSIVEACRRICEWSGAPWMLENPVGTLSSYWRKPDYTFQPWQYGDTYTKKTCLWTGGGFVMPPAINATMPEGTKPLIHHMPPSADRGDKRSVTPEGFARAVFQANEPLVKERAA